MIIVFKPTASEENIQFVLQRVEQSGLKPHLSKGLERTIVGVIGDERAVQKETFSLMPGVESVIRVLKPFKLASRDFHPENTIVDVNGVRIGDRGVVVIAGPCSVESEEQLLMTAEQVRASGARLLRGGAFKPRSSPYAFQGLGEDGLRILARAREKTGLGIVTEVMESSDVGLVAEYADMLQVGARNMQNTKLLRALSKVRTPVLLKRNFSATLGEFLMSAEYVLAGGNEHVVLCERGIRTFVEYTRNTLDLNVVPAVKTATHLPIIVDPSHGTGRHEYVIPMSRAAVAAGADGLLVEVHTSPRDALSDGEQSLTPDVFSDLMGDITGIAAAVGRTVA